MLLKDLTEFGQRYPGAPKRDKAIEKQAALLRRTGAAVELQSFARRLRSMESLIHLQISSEGSTQNVGRGFYLEPTLIRVKSLTLMPSRNVERHRLQVRMMVPAGLPFS